MDTQKSEVKYNEILELRIPFAVFLYLQILQIKEREGKKKQSFVTSSCSFLQRWNIERHKKTKTERKKK